MAMRTTEMWWEQAKARGRYVVGVVIGPRKCGKTSWFANLAADPTQDVVLWKVLRVARARTTDEVWSDLWKLLGFSTHGAGDDPIEHLEMGLEIRGRGLTLVVDDWDRAIEERGASVSDACYEVLDALARFCIDQARERDRSVFLGLVLLTSLPDTADLQYFAKTAQRATFERLSQVVTRSFDTLRFPMLDREEARRCSPTRGSAGGRPGSSQTRAAGGWACCRKPPGWSATTTGHRPRLSATCATCACRACSTTACTSGSRCGPRSAGVIRLSTWSSTWPTDARRRTSACRTTSTTPAGRRH